MRRIYPFYELTEREKLAHVSTWGTTLPQRFTKRPRRLSGPIKIFPRSSSTPFWSFTTHEIGG